MKLKALDQISISAVQPDSLRPGQEFEVSDAYGEELLAVHPKLLKRVEDVSAKDEGSAPANKAEKPLANKARREKKARTAK